MTAQDKTGTEIHAGDTIEFVYGGDAYAAVVEQIHHEEHELGPHKVYVSIELWIPAAATTVTVKATKPKPRSQETKPDPAAETTEKTPDPTPPKSAKSASHTPPTKGKK